MGGLRSLWWRKTAEHHNAQQTRMWAEYKSRGYGEQQTTVRPRRRPRTEPQDPVVFGVLMALAIGVACVLTLEPTTCPYGARHYSRVARALADGESYDAAALGRPQRDHTGRFYQMREIRERHGACSWTIRIKARARRMATPVKTWRRSSQRPKVSWRGAPTDATTSSKR